jgi:hypothetical protein
MSIVSMWHGVDCWATLLDDGVEAMDIISGVIYDTN